MSDILAFPVQFDARNDLTLAVVLLGVASVIWALRAPVPLRAAAAWTGWLGGAVILEWWMPGSAAVLAWAGVGLVGAFLARSRPTWAGASLGLLIAIASYTAWNEISWSTAAHRWEAYRGGSVHTLDGALAGASPSGLVRLVGARCERDAQVVTLDGSSMKLGNPLFAVVGRTWAPGDPV